jgi:hypothetical protein
MSSINPMSPSQQTFGDDSWPSIVPANAAAFYADLPADALKHFPIRKEFPPGKLLGKEKDDDKTLLKNSSAKTYFIRLSNSSPNDLVFVSNNGNLKIKIPLMIFENKVYLKRKDYEDFSLDLKICRAQSKDTVRYFQDFYTLDEFCGIVKDLGFQSLDFNSLTK